MVNTLVHTRVSARPGNSGTVNIAMPQQNQSLIRSPILWGLMLASFAVSLTLGFFLNIRFDEAFTLETTSRDVVYAFRQAITFEQQAPLYFVILSVWRNMDSSIFFARLFSVLCFPLFIWVAAEVAKRYLQGVNPLYVAAVVAVHQQVVWSSLDIRLYSMMLLLSGLLYLLFYDGYLAERPRTHSRVLYIIVAVLALYTQYYLGFQLAAAAVALVVLKRWTALSRCVFDMAIAGLLFVPMLFAIAGQVGDVSAQTEIALSWPELVQGIYRRIVPLIISVEWIQFDFLKRWLARIVIVAIIALFVTKLVRNRRSAEDVTLGVVAAVTIGLFFAIYSLAGDQTLQLRHMSSLLLPMVLIPFAALSSLKSSRLVVGWLILIVFLNIGYLYFAYKPLAKPGDFHRVAEFVMANEKASEPVLVFHADAVLPLRHYYRGQNNLIAIPQENNLTVWDPRNNILRDEAQILDLIDKQSGNPQRFWLVHDGWCAQGSLSFNCQILEDVVGKYFDVVRIEQFFEPTTVRLLRRK